MLKIAITGGIACGKSLVGSFFSEAGLAVCDADDLAHGLIMSGSDVFEEIIKLFDYFPLLVNANLEIQIENIEILVKSLTKDTSLNINGSESRTMKVEVI